MTKWVVVGAMIAVSAVLAIPVWLAMRAFNHFRDKRLAEEEEARGRAADAEIARVREAIKYGRRLD